MSGTPVASVFAEVGLRDEGLAVGLNKLLDRAVGFKNALVGSVAGAAVIGAFTRLTQQFMGVVDALDKLKDRARETRTPIEQLSLFEFAGKLNGIDNVTQMLNFLTKNLGEAASGNQELAATFQALGVDAAAFVSSGRPAIDLMGKLLDGLGKMDPARAHAASMAVFGRAGYEVAKFGSSEEFRQSMADAKAAGAGVTQAQADAADALNDELAKLGEEIGSLTRETVTGLIPVLMELTKAISQSGLLQNTSHLVGQTVKSGEYGAGAGVVGAAVGLSLMKFMGEREAASDFLMGAIKDLTTIFFGAAKETAKEAAEVKKIRGPQRPAFVTELGPRPAPLPDSPEDLKRARDALRSRLGDEATAAWNRYADAMDAVNEKVNAMNNAQRSMPALVDVGSYWTTAQSAIVEDVQKKQLSIAEQSLERLKRIAEALEKKAEDASDAVAAVGP
ncbi:MAG: hypothetical protein JSS51_04410 [Planctomycetes bacterium]|nr:hypothetical protein [Planctomycetota bacterium]